MLSFYFDIINTSAGEQHDYRNCSTYYRFGSTPDPHYWRTATHQRRMAVIYTISNPEPNKAFVERLNRYAIDSCMAQSLPYGWVNCGQNGDRLYYLARCGGLDLYITYDRVADIFIGSHWE